MGTGEVQLCYIVLYRVWEFQKDRHCGLEESARAGHGRGCELASSSLGSVGYNIVIIL